MTVTKQLENLGFLQFIASTESGGTSGDRKTAPAVAEPIIYIVILSSFTDKLF